MDIKPIFKEVPVIGCKGPVSNYETEPILVGASIRLNIPSEFSNNNNVRELLKEVGEEVGSNVVEEVSQKIIENMAGVKINPKGANVVSMIFSFQEIGKGSSLTEQYQERVKIEQTQAIDAVINYHLNQFKHK